MISRGAAKGTSWQPVSRSNRASSVSASGAPDLSGREQARARRASPKVGPGGAGGASPLMPPLGKQVGGGGRMLPGRRRNSGDARRRIVALFVFFVAAAAMGALGWETLRGLVTVSSSWSAALQQWQQPQQQQQAEELCAAPPPSFEPTWEEILSELQKYPKFNLEEATVRNYAKLVHSYLAPWHPIKGAPSGLGAGGMVTPESLIVVSQLPQIMSCNGHVRIVHGKVYFRYGGFYHVGYRLNRFLQTVKMIHDAVDDYGLSDIRSEFFINTCDTPMSFYSNHWEGRAGYPIFSTGITADTMDIAIPDPLDLTDDYTPDLSGQSAWETKEPRVVFRGKTTNFDMLDGNWGANPRIRLHRMSDVHSDVMETHINSWSHASSDVIKQMERDGVRLAKRMNFTEFNAFKYQVIVDGGGGSCRTCGVLRSNQLSIRQETPMPQFYEALMEDKREWVFTARTFSDLPDIVKWARANDAEAQQIVKNANDFASFACTWHGRELYWAVLIAKFQTALENPERVDEPTSLCPDKPILDAVKGVNPASVRCNDPDAASKQEKCAFFCAGGKIPLESFKWLRADVLRDVRRVGPP